MDRQSAFFRAGGTMEPTAPNYIERAADAELLSKLIAGEYVFLLDSRQKGKSSLVARTIHKLREKGVRTVKLDLQWLGANVTPEQWYAGLLSEIGQDLGLESELLEYWNSRLSIGPLSRWIGALRDVVLAKTTDPVVIFIDEIDFVRALPFPTDEFFAGIRDCYNRRSESRGFERVTFCIVGVATPGQLIRNSEITPFNIGTRIDLSDFTLEETLPFAEQLSTSEKDGGRLLRRVYYWVSGHPYLTQLLCSHIVLDPNIKSEQAVDRLVSRLFFTPEARHREPNFADIERRVLDPDVPGLSPDERRTQVLDLYGRLLKGGQVRGEEENPVVATLRLSGLGLEDQGSLRLRNRTYGTVFDERWRRSSLPDAELRRQRGAARVAILRTAAVAGMVVLAISTAAVGIFSISKDREKALVALGQKTKDLAKTSDDRKSALESLSERNRQLDVLSRERQEALVSLRLRNEDVKSLSEKQQDTLSLLAGSNENLKRSGQEKEQALINVQRVADTLRSQNYAFLVSSIGSSKLSKAVETFSKAQPDSNRGWEWGHLSMLFEKPVTSAIITQLGYFENQPDGRTMVASSYGLYDVSPKGITLRTRFNQVSGGGWDSNQPFPLYRRGSMRVWMSTKGHAILDAESHDVIVPYQREQILDINPKARTYLSASPNVIEVRDIDSGRLLGSRYWPGVLSADFLPDGSCISTHFDKDTRMPVIHRWDIAGKDKVVRPAVRTFRRLDFSADGTRYAVFERHRGEVRRTSDDAVVSFIPELPAMIQDVVFSPDASQLLIGAADGGVRLYETETAKLLRTFVDHWLIFKVAFLPDGKHIASSGAGIKVWSLESHPAMETFSDTASQTAFVSGDGVSLITQSMDGTILSRNLSTGKVVNRAVGPSGEKAHLARSDSLDRVLLGLFDGRVARLDAGTLKEELVERVFATGPVWVKVLPGGRQILTGVYDQAKQSIRCATLDANSLVVSSRFQLKSSDRHLLEEKPCTSYSLDGSSFAITSHEDKQVRVYATSNGRLLRSINADNPIYAVALSPNGKKIAISVAEPREPGQIDIIDTITGTKTGYLVASTDTAVGWMDYSPNGNFLTGWTMNDSGHLWDLRTKKEIATFPKAMGHHYGRFSSDGGRLITSGRFWSFGIWDGRTGSELLTLNYQFVVGLAPYAALPYSDDARFTTDGQRIVARCTDGAVRIYNTVPWKNQPKAVRK